MCLNRLPFIKKCLFCLKLRIAVILISILGLTVSLIMIVLANKLGLEDASNEISFVSWFVADFVKFMVAWMLLIAVSSGSIRSRDAGNVMLQVFFWLIVGILVIHLTFCITLLAFCWSSCLTNALIHLAAFTLLLFVMSYLLLIVNSYRMSLF